jgi:N utilization substance protein B
MTGKSRSGARRLLVQAWYQAQISGHDLGQLREQYAEHQNYDSVDKVYFDTLLREIDAERADLDHVIGEFGDIPAEQLDPVEHAILWVALAELRLHPDVPPKVVINEAINLAKMFGGEGGHRYINGLLDKAAAGVLRQAGNQG